LNLERRILNIELNFKIHHSLFNIHHSTFNIPSACIFLFNLEIRRRGEVNSLRHLNVLPSFVIRLFKY